MYYKIDNLMRGVFKMGCKIEKVGFYAKINRNNCMSWCECSNNDDFASILKIFIFLSLFNKKGMLIDLAVLEVKLPHFLRMIC